MQISSEALERAEGPLVFKKDSAPAPRSPLSAVGPRALRLQPRAPGSVRFRSFNPFPGGFPQCGIALRGLS